VDVEKSLKLAARQYKNPHLAGQDEKKDVRLGASADESKDSAH